MPQNDALVQPQLELDQINYFIPEPDMEDYMYTTAGPTSNKTTSHGVVVRGEEIGIVLSTFLQLYNFECKLFHALILFLISSGANPLGRSDNSLLQSLGQDSNA